MIFGDNILAFKRFMDKHYSDIPIRYVLDAQQEYQSYIGYQSNELPQNGSYSRIFLTMSYHEKYHPIIRKFVIFFDIEFSRMSHTPIGNIVEYECEIIHRNSDDLNNFYYLYTKK